MTQKRKNENDLAMSGSAAAAPRRKPVRTRAKHSAAAGEAPGISVSAGPEIAEPAAALSETALSATNVEPFVTSTEISTEPLREEIARLAYSYWEARGCQGGSAEEDWLRAEVEIRGASTAV